MAQTVADGPGLSELEIDGRIHRRLVELAGSGSGLTIDAAAALAAGLPIEGEASGQVRLDSLKLHQWRFDALRQRLIIRLLRKSDGANLRDFAAREYEDAQRRTIAALRLDYDLNMVAGRGGAQAAGLVGGAFVKGDLVLATSAQIAAGSGPRPAPVRRLDSFAQLRLGNSGAVITAGDFVSAGSATQRPVRMGGIQLTSDFRHRPDMVTSPMPAFTGNVAVPTSLDILAADQTYQLGELEPGEFTVRNIPINPGRGAVAVRLTDALGRETIRTIDFYQSHTLLRKGLRSYALNAGFVRRRYGTDRDTYGPFGASAYYRRGLSPFLTVEASAEMTPGMINAGGRGDFTIGNVALSTLELRRSQSASGGGGFLLNAAIESIGNRLSARAGVSVPTSGYADVASHLGDSPPRSQVFANIAFDLARNAPLQFSYVRLGPSEAPRYGRGSVPNDLLTANLFYSPNSRINLSLNAGMRSAETRSVFVSGGLTMRFGARHAVSLGAGHNGGQTTTALGYQFNDHAATGLRAQASLGTLGSTPRFNASAIHEGRWTTLNGGFVLAQGQIAGQLSATGTLITTGGTLYARGASENGYALVRAGKVAGVPVKLENRLVGKTDRRGHLLVPNLRPMVPQHIDIDGARLPADAVVLTSRHVVTVPQRAIGLVDIDAMYFRPIAIKLTDTRGAALEAGLPVVALPSGRETLVGFDGMLEFNTASGDRRLIVGAAEGRCEVAIPKTLPDPDDALVCRPMAVIAGPRRTDDSPPKVARRD
ncbi:fimbria/pilus outer membrane usher protein [Qipengyuania sediminis]|uniref:fimbria/pilus outer membrane usher protein n=1 Tax=Qipengyuania sediminis TaxID=1532023 RepID=UPI001404A7DE|nr:fimbria/pilus outer membrane usher protein [Qipengyuania sediminis]